jgi:putative membrane protein
MMNGWDGYGYGYGAFHMVIWVVVLAAIVVGVMWLVRSLTSAGAHSMTVPRSSGLGLLEERYARGEVNREEYLQKKGDLQA